MSAAIVSPVSPVFSFATFTAMLDAVDSKTTVNALRKAGGLSGVLSAFAKTGNKGQGNMGAYAHVYRGILEVVQYGQKNKLLGFAIASKKASHVFQALVNLGILTTAGKVAIGYTEGVGNVTETMADATNFVAWCLSVDATGREAAKVASEATKEEETAQEEALNESQTLDHEATIAPVVLTPGQAADAATALIIQAFTSGTLSTDNQTALYAAFAPHGIKPAPKAKVTAPAQEPALM